MNTGNKPIEPKLLFAGCEKWFTSKPQEVVPTPLDALNEIIVGLPESELVLIAAKPGQGKTSLAMQMAIDTAQSGIPVGFFSMEMSRQQLGQRILCALSGVNSNRVRDRKTSPLTQNELDHLNEAMIQVETLPIYVDDRGGLNNEEVYTAAKHWQEKYRVKAFFLDYVQLMEGASDNRQETIGSAARIFKQIAKEAEAPFVALSQVNRASDGRENKTPLLSDLRDSGQLEQVADMVFMFSYPNSPDDDVDAVRHCQIHVKKNRNGSTGIANVQFDRKRTIFEELDPTEIDRQKENRPQRAISSAVPKLKPWAGPKKDEVPS